MTPQRALLFKFLTVCAAGFGLACAATAWVMVWVIRWTISNCGEGTACSIGNWLIDFWWAPFVLVVLMAAAWLRRTFDRMVARLPDASRHIVT
jgi:hypothetical protein